MENKPYAIHLDNLQYTTAPGGRVGNEENCLAASESENDQWCAGTPPSVPCKMSTTDSNINIMSQILLY